jgi:hypothetical protein
MKFLSVIAVGFLCLAFSFTSGNGKSRYPGYQQLPNESCLKYHQKGSGTVTVDSGGALFLKMWFLTERDSAFLDVNAASLIPSYAMILDQVQYAGDFQDILGKLHTGDSVSFFMSLDSLNKYYPAEFVFGEPWDKMKYIGMSVKVDSMYTLPQVTALREAAAENGSGPK